MEAVAVFYVRIKRMKACLDLPAGQPACMHARPRSTPSTTCWARASLTSLTQMTAPLECGDGRQGVQACQQQAAGDTCRLLLSRGTATR